ncbi:MAG: AbrB/MazE/SpoVT family DNA-binding domain-containing protein [Chloroflexia bacterium]|nr:AbrB/MazE/SpoVT family DNA-binding domain-containing protein [Chloroflexia bacterium]
MRVMVKKWGNSASIRIPSSVMQAAHLEIDQEVDIREEGGVVIVAPVRRVTYDLDELIAGITEDNKHEFIAFGEPVGKEIW